MRLVERLFPFFLFAAFLAPSLLTPRVSSSEKADSPPLFMNVSPPRIHTDSRFHEVSQKRTETISFSTQYRDDPEQELGVKTLIVQGEVGEMEVTTRTIYYDNTEYSKSVEERVVREPIEEVVARGTKILHRQIETDYGSLTYWKKLSDVWATSYDSSCVGCSTTTATGMRQGYGVVAVDPDVIPLHTRVYVPGYGVAVAGDVGGSVKGMRIDLGFDSLNGQWSAQAVDVYFLVY